MRARLDRDAHALRLCVADDVERLGGGDVHDVRAGPRVPRGVDDRADRLDLGDGRTGCDELREDGAGCLPEVILKLGVRDEEAINVCKLREGRLELAEREVSNSSMPLGARKHFTPTAPAARRGRSELRFSGTAPPQ